MSANELAQRILAEHGIGRATMPDITRLSTPDLLRLAELLDADTTEGDELPPDPELLSILERCAQ